jgi:DNA (cytosine-5)-methyltransferase 1
VTIALCNGFLYNGDMIRVETERTLHPANRFVAVHEAARALNVSADTIRRWEKKGLVKAERTANNYRAFKLDELKRAEAKYRGSDGRAFKILRSRKTRHNVIELFAGCGGMALGLENAGLKPELLVDIDKDCVSSLRENRPKWKVIQDDIANLDLTCYEGKIDVVAGGFPCQAFSYAGHSRGFDDTRGTLFFEFARCVKEIQPKLVVAENVRGLIRHDGGRTIATMMNVLNELGYYVDHQLLRSQFLDVPQKRERVFIIGIRKDLEPAFIYPKEKDYTVSLRAALKGCPDSAGSKYPKWKREIMDRVPPGGYWRDLPPKLQKQYMKSSYFRAGGKTGMARRLSFDEPSLTLTCNPAQKHTERCHPAETRPLTIREYARIQSFPDEWKFTGSTASQYRQVGNALPVNMAYHVGRCLVAMLDGEFDPDKMTTRPPKRIMLQQPILLPV